MSETEAQRKTRAANLKARFGITIEQYEQMLADQDGKCAICKRPPKANRRLAVDHDHTNGNVRGLLCTPCNRELKYWDLHPEYIIRAHHYLEKEPYTYGTAKNRPRQ